MSSQDSPTPQTGRLARVTTYLITNGTKVVGVYIILKERTLDDPKDSVLIIGGVLALGAQTVEAIVLATIDRFFGNGGRSK